jgi:hypothetical protein
MIKPGSLVRLNPKFYSITYAGLQHASYVGMVIEVETDFYKPSIVPNKGQSRHYILWGNETYTYEPTNALVEVLPDGD